MSDRSNRSGGDGEQIAKVRALFVEDEKARRAWDGRARRRVKLHTFTGLLTFFALSVLFGAPEVFEPQTLLLTFITSAIFGLPLGYVISKLGGGFVRGAAVSIVAFTVTFTLVQLFARGGISLHESLVAGVLFGAIPGGLIGWHVGLDT